MNKQLDPITMLIYALSPILGEIGAEFVGTYAVIIVAAAVGGSWALSRRRSTGSNWTAFRFLVLVVTTAVLLTWGISAIISHYTGVHLTWLLVPVALLIGGVGHDWGRVSTWFVRRFFEKRMGD